LKPKIQRPNLRPLGQKRSWKTVPSEMANGWVTAQLLFERPLVCYFSVADRRDVTASTPHVTLLAP